MIKGEESRLPKICACVEKLFSVQESSQRLEDKLLWFYLSKKVLYEK